MKAPWKKLSFVLASVLSTAGLASAACWEEVLYQRDDTYLVVESGAAYRIIGNPSAVQLWYPLSVVYLCDQAGYVEGEWLNYFEVRNADAGGLVWAVPVD
jgi:hypothetical protein